jgi:hypothetical protein
MEIINCLAGYIILLLTGAFAWYSSVIVSEQKMPYHNKPKKPKKKGNKPKKK